MNRKLWWVALAGVSVFVVVLAIGYLVWDKQFSPKAQAIQIVKDSLNDPSSAVFEKVRYIKRTGATCGGVNAKNRMGGYVGTTFFIVTKDGTVTFAPISDTKSGSTESRIEALQEHINFLNKMAVCDEESDA